MLRYPATSSVLMQRLQAILAGDYSRVTGNPETNPEAGFLQVEILLNQIWVFSPDGWQRILIATKQNAPLDNNPSLVLKGDVLLYSKPWLHPRETRGSRPNGGLREGFPASEIVGLWKSSRLGRSRWRGGRCA
jgi:hypothetical protein